MMVYIAWENAVLVVFPAIVHMSFYDIFLSGVLIITSCKDLLVKGF